MTQEQALNILKMGESVFLTGNAGSGKTYVLNKYIDYLKKNWIPAGITASTGIAATHLSGTTIHSWSGIGVSDKLSRKRLRSLLDKKYLQKHFLANQVLIIDEVSMLHAHQLDMVNEIAQAFRQDARPFGGMQVVLSGDFFQLPPVADGDKPASFIFRSDIWQKMKLRVCYLTEQHRQDDQIFLEMLNKIRAGTVDDKVVELLSERVVVASGHSGKTKLFTHNVDVDRFNQETLKSLDGQYQCYSANYHGRDNLVDLLSRSCLAMDNLEIKVGAKVMFIKNNFEAGVVNGTIGRVFKYNALGYPVVKVGSKLVVAEPDTWVISEDQRILAQIKQVPLRLAWAVTVHKSQGMTLSEAEIDLTRAFQPGMGYVALSRVRDLKGLRLRGFNDVALTVDPVILSVDKILQDASDKVTRRLSELRSHEIVSRHEKFIAENAVKKEPKPKKVPNRYITEKMVEEKLSLEEMAKRQNFKVSTIAGHIEDLYLEGRKMDIQYLVNLKPGELKKIKAAFNKCGYERLKPVFEELREKYDYNTLRLMRVVLLKN